jgi:citrate synthase
VTAVGRSGASRPLVTRSGTSTATMVRVRGRDLVEELIGQVGFAEMLYLLCCERPATPAEARLLDACLVTLMEHGLTPSAVISRLMADSVPEEPQVAIGAGLLAIGSVYAGTTEQCAALLVAVAARIERGEREAVEAAAGEHALARRPVPGFGHGTHKPDDPRAQKLLALAEASGLPLSHVPLLRRLGEAVDRAFGRHLTINATGAIGAILLDIGVPVAAMRGFSVVARAGGLVGHWVEERAAPAGPAIWAAAKAAVPYVEHSEGSEMPPAPECGSAGPG